MNSKIVILKNKYVKIFALTLFFCMLVLSVFQIVQINSAYPQATIICAKNGETLKLDGLEFNENSFEIIPYKNIINDEKLNTIVAPIEDGEVNIIKVSVKMSNISQNIIEFPLYDVILQSSAWANAINLDTFKYFNNNRSLIIKIKPNESIDLVLPYLIHKIQFSQEKWSKIESEKYDLVFSMYPTKHIISLK